MECKGKVWRERIEVRGEIEFGSYSTSSPHGERIEVRGRFSPVPSLRAPSLFSLMAGSGEAISLSGGLRDCFGERTHRNIQPDHI